MCSSEFMKRKVGCSPRQHQPLSATRKLHVCSINAGGKFGKFDNFNIWTALMRSEGVRPDVIFISEFDKQRNSTRSVYSREYAISRFWSNGMWAMAWAVRRTLLPQLIYRKWRGRAGTLVFRGQHQCMMCVGMHVAHGELRHQTLSEGSWLIRQKSRPTPLAIMADWNTDLLPSTPTDPWFADR